MLRTYRDYELLRTFLFIGRLLSFLELIIGFRVLIHYLLTGMETSYLPSATLTAVLQMVGFQIIVLCLVADMLGVTGS